MQRRNFINFFLGGSLLGTCIAFLYPVIRYILPAKQTEAVIKKITAAKVGELAPNTSKIFKFGSSPGILINTQDGELRAFSAICTHLTCSVIYESDTGTLLCPCHNGRFDLRGNVVSGPPPSPLESYIVEISGEEIVVSKRD
ncbi:MAG: Rieske 2Fe-2S domain-containing protein [Candidatus Aminicenantes bacterium]|nr:MAG: Rieske 2Fe-2S domain-containing protein [Candidatus Aminicenantes bacterium]